MIGSTIPPAPTDRSVLIPAEANSIRFPVRISLNVKVFPVSTLCESVLSPFNDESPFEATTIFVFALEDSEFVILTKATDF